MDLTEAQWQVLKPLLTPKRRPDGRGPPWRDARAVFNGILWVLRTGAPWHDLPDRYRPYQTCHRRFQQWQRDGTLTRLLHTLAEDLRVRGKLDLSETFIDASFSSAKKGALLSARLAAEKEVKSWRSQTAMVFLSPAASPAPRRSRMAWMVLQAGTRTSLGNLRNKRSLSLRAPQVGFSRRIETIMASSCSGSLLA
jgi:transposase